MNLASWVEQYYDRDRDYVLITGASSGIGREYFNAFAAQRCRCIATSEDAHGLAQAAQEVRDTHRAEVVEVVADLSDQRGIDCLLRSVEPYSIAAVINNAGFGIKGPFLSHDCCSYTKLLHVNAVAPTQITHQLLPSMMAARRGLVIHVASINACTPIGFNAVYTATKAYSLYYAVAVAYEFRSTPIRFQVVLPGTTNTPFHVKQGAVPQAMTMEPQLVVSRSLSRIDREISVSNRLDHCLLPLISALPLRLRVRVATYILKKRLKLDDRRVASADSVSVPSEGH